MSGLRRSLARGGAHSMVALPRGGGPRAAPRAVGAFASGQKGREGTPSPDETYSLEPGGPGPPNVVGMAIRLSEEVKAALLSAEKDGVVVQIRFGANSQSHVLKIGEQEYSFTSNEEDPKKYESYIERKEGGQTLGRLAEVGPIVKKLNLQRSLTAAEANKLKQRSVAAEKQLKARKAIVLEHGSAFDAKQAVPLARKAAENVRKTFKVKDKVLPVIKKAKPVEATPSPSRPPLQPPSRSQSPIPPSGPAPTPHNLGPSRLAVSSPPTEPSASALSPVLRTGPSELQASRSSVPPEEGGQEKGAKVPPGKSTPKRAATNQELKAAVVGALAAAPEFKMKQKSIERNVREALPDAGFTPQQLVRLLGTVAVYKSPGFYHLKPDVEKAFRDGRIMNSTSPETVASDSPALNLESPPLAATPPPEAEAQGPSDTAAEGGAVASEEGAKAGDMREERDLRQGGGWRRKNRTLGKGPIKKLRV